ncbi:MAG TPA: DUF4349 domain-containing protein [Pyrinomonadaceae bacterium]|jgi:hypothetical protein|nr:DUF4349 domain-containing protein [Pyrinomonadaceae bacterium]
MRLSLALALALATFALAGCGGSARSSMEKSAELPPTGNAASQDKPAADASRAGGGGGAQRTVQDVSLQQADAAQAQPVPAERKIIRDATLTLEVEEPVKAAERITSIAESRGGYVVSSESRHVSSGGRKGKAYEVFTVQFRVPAAQFEAALKDVRATAGEVTAEKVSGKDVTEEYIDLEARLRTQRALEAQLLDIMKTANAVSDALSVQRELATVRGDIERVEGRRRFLESQSSLSTINVTLQPPAPLLATTGFFHSVAEALGDGVDIAANITLFLIRALLALLPVFLFLVLPAYFILRYLLRRLSRRTQPPVVAAPVVAPPQQSPYDDGPRPAV